MDFNFLEENIETFKFSKPRKYKNGELMLSKIKSKNNGPIIVQFPKMELISDVSSKVVNLQFINESVYTKKVNGFLTDLDTFLVGFISKKSEDWFGKQIPVESVEKMYTKIIKLNCEKKSVSFVNSKFSEEKELVKGDLIECISQLKYIVFTKESCFIHCEICTLKRHNKKVDIFNFIEDPMDNLDSDSEFDEEIVTFF